MEQNGKPRNKPTYGFIWSLIYKKKKGKKNSWERTLFSINGVWKIEQPHAKY